jgi:hypothetical protein
MRSKIVRYDVEKLKNNGKFREFQENIQKIVRVNSNPETIDET